MVGYFSKKLGRPTAGEPIISSLRIAGMAMRRDTCPSLERPFCSLPNNHFWCMLNDTFCAEKWRKSMIYY